MILSYCICRPNNNFKFHNLQNLMETYTIVLLSNLPPTFSHITFSHILGFLHLNGLYLLIYLFIPFYMYVLNEYFNCN